MKNEYGLDVSYFEDKLKQIVRDVKNYTPDEMARALARLSVVADESVLSEKEFARTTVINNNTGPIKISM